MEGPSAYVFPADQKRLGQLRDMMNLLRSMGVEIHQSDQAFTAKLLWPPKKKEEPEAKKEEPEKQSSKEKKKDTPAEKKEPEEIKFPAGSFVIRMDQPYSRLADTLLDTQFVLGKERVYDDTGWTLGYTKNLEFRRVVDETVLKVPMKIWDGSIKPSETKGSGKALAIRNTADTDFIRLRYELPDVKFSVLQEEYKMKAGSLPAGTIVAPLDDRVQKAVAAYGTFRMDVLDSMPALKSHELPLPRIALLHTWLDTQDEGWWRLAFDDLKVPYDYLSTQDISSMADLKSTYDVIVFPPVDASAHDIVNGLPKGMPLP